MKITKSSKVTFVELPPTQFGILNGEISRDVYSRIRLPSRAIHVLEGILRADKWENVESINPLYHGKNGRLSDKNFDRIYSSEILGISSITRTSKQSMRLAELYKLKNPKGIVIAGGPDPTFRTEEWLKYVDIVVRGEGEKTISELMERLEINPEELEDVNGIAFKRDGKIEITKPRKLMSVDELSRVPHPFYDKITRQKVDTGVVETSRGCPNDCDFCGVTEFYGRRYRTKSIEYVIEELKQIKDVGKTYFLTDDNFAALPSHSIDLLKAIVANGLNKRIGTAQVTVDIADNSELLKALKKAKIMNLCIGVESICDETLRHLGKPYSVEENKSAIKKLREEGFWIHGMMMLGGDGDTKETLKETFDWVNKNLDSVQLFSPTPLPGTRFFSRMQEDDRILTRDWSLYDAQHVVIKPKYITPYDLQEKICDMYLDFYSFSRNFNRVRKSTDKRLAFAVLMYTNVLRGIKKSINDPQLKNHLEFLRSLS